MLGNVTLRQVLSNPDMIKIMFDDSTPRARAVCPQARVALFFLQTELDVATGDVWQMLRGREALESAATPNATPRTPAV